MTYLTKSPRTENSHSTQSLAQMLCERKSLRSISKHKDSLSGTAIGKYTEHTALVPEN